MRERIEIENTYVQTRNDSTYDLYMRQYAYHACPCRRAHSAHCHELTRLDQEIEGRDQMEIDCARVATMQRTCCCSVKRDPGALSALRLT